MDPVVFESRDIGETEAFLSAAYARMRITGDVPRPQTHISRRTVESLSMDELFLDYTMGYHVDPLGKVCLGTVESGSIVHRVEGELEDTFVAGDVVLFAPPDRPYSGEIRRSRYATVMFDPALLTRVAAAEPGRSAGPIRLRGYRPVSAAAGRRLKNTIAYLRDNVLTGPVAAEAPLVVSTSQQLLAASVLDALPSDAATEETARERRDAHPETLRRAIAFIEGTSDDPITAADIAAATRVSIRALQYAFHRHMGTTPMAYVRQVRLAAAHDDLSTAASAETTVTMVAARWGFAHPGRFAQLYKAAYGRAPSVTLRE